MVSECSSIIPELKSYLHFSWYVLNMSKPYGSAFDGNELLHSLLWGSEGTYRSGSSLSQRWEADWEKKKKRGKIKWSVVVNFELNKALWLLSSVQMQVSPRHWFALFFYVMSSQWSFLEAFTYEVCVVSGLGENLQQLIAQDTGSPHQSVLSLSFLPLAQRVFLYVKRNSYFVGRREQRSCLFSFLFERWKSELGNYVTI